LFVFKSADETDDEGDIGAYLDEEPEEVRNAWEELMMIQREQQRYTDIRMDQQHDLNKLRKEQKKLEDVSIIFCLFLACP
jgi:spore coat polysaccharide biosynthesis protein SpsF (cytidylyltransferase family)